MHHHVALGWVHHARTSDFLRKWLGSSVFAVCAGMLIATSSLLPVADASPITISATSSSSDGAHVATKTLDGSLAPESRWSAYGDGQWIQYDLGAPALIKSVDIAFYTGNQRKTYFDIQVSSNAAMWTTVLSKKSSSGTTSSFENFDFADTEGQYVRIVGHGNSVNLWNSVLETKIDYFPKATVAKAVYFENFESLTPGSSWAGNKRLKVLASCGVNNSKCLRVTYVPTSRGSERLIVKQTLPAALEYTLNYDVLFENGFNFVKAGKLPGFGPVSDTTGCAEWHPAGWSVRTHWIRDGEAILYVYDQNRDNRCGEVTPSGVKFTPDGKTWHAISAYVKVNQPATASNGEMALYMNGTLIAEIKSAQLRSAEGTSTIINRFLFVTFFGGSDSTFSSNKTEHSRFDNFAVYPGLRVRTAPGQ